MNEGTENYFPRLSLPQARCTHEVIKYVKKGMARYNLEYTNKTDRLRSESVNVKDRDKV